MKRQAQPESSGEPTRLTDSQLVQACLKGDSAGWETLILRYQRLIYSIPIKNGFSAVDAADVFQSVCVALLEKLPTLRDYGKISSWLMTTTTRECWRVAAQWRRERPHDSRDPDQDRDPMSEIPSPEPLADEMRANLERQQILREAITALSERCRRLLEMLFYQKEELSYSDIARRMSMPVASIGPTRARCLEKLKKWLEGKL
jgi:RNA polymerase sigma factor (sigma-70 family)